MENLFFLITNLQLPIVSVHRHYYSVENPPEIKEDESIKLLFLHKVQKNILINFSIHR